MPVFKPGRPSDGQPTSSRSAPLSVLAPGLRILGEIETEGTITIEGRLEGNLQGRTQVLIAPGGVVLGDIVADEVVVVGRVDGNISATSRIELRHGGVIQGDLTTPRLVVHEGGVVNGRLRAERPAAVASFRSERLRKSA